LLTAANDKYFTLFPQYLNRQAAANQLLPLFIRLWCGRLVHSFSFAQTINNCYSVNKLEEVGKVIVVLELVSRKVKTMVVLLKLTIASLIVFGGVLICKPKDF